MSRRHAQLEMDPVYGFFHGLCRIAHQMFFRGDVAGLENLPRTGGYIVAANHASLLDPPDRGPVPPEPGGFFARKTLWKPGIAAWWLDAVGTIPVDRDGGTSLDAIKRVLRALAGGRAVIVFPEGTRSPNGELQAAKAGRRPPRLQGPGPRRARARYSARSRPSARTGGSGSARPSRSRTDRRSPPRITTTRRTARSAMRGRPSRIMEAITRIEAAPIRGDLKAYSRPRPCGPA